MVTIGVAIASLVVGYAFRGAIRKDIAKIVDAAKAEEQKALSAAQAELKKDLV